MSRRVMVVDDEPSIRFTVETILQLAGMEVVAVESGKRCIEALENGFRGVILIDVMMPGMDGWETLREIDRRGLSDGNVLSMLTAKEHPDRDMEEMTEMLVNYIRKPFESDELVATVKEYLSSLDQLAEGQPAS